MGAECCDKPVHLHSMKVDYTEPEPEQKGKKRYSEADITAIADYMRGRNGIRLKNAKQLQKRVEYFKGNKFIEFLMDDEAKAKDKSRPFVDSETDALRIGTEMLRLGYIHRSEVADKQRKELRPVRSNNFVKEGFYTFIYSGDKSFSNLLTGLLIAAFLACCLFPVWPMSMKVGIWYISVTLLLVIFGFIFLRLFMWFFPWLLGMEFWLYPNVFADDLGFWDSWKPFISFEKAEPGQAMYRALALTCVGCMAYYVATAPTEFDEYVQLQKAFVDDLYAGTLLSDRSEAGKADIDKVHIPSVEELAMEEEMAGLDGMDDVELDMDM